MNKFFRIVKAINLPVLGLTFGAVSVDLYKIIVDAKVTKQAAEVDLALVIISTILVSILCFKD